MRIDMIGKQFGRLVVLANAESARTPGGQAKPRVLARCDCGVEKTYKAEHVRRGLSTSCGCRRRDVTAARNLTHGLTRAPEYGVWCAMRERCTDANNKFFHAYGGRGIRVCPQWSDFAVFYADMGARPGKGWSIDRIDNDGNYEPGNCRWATASQQRRNRRDYVGPR